MTELLARIIARLDAEFKVVTLSSSGIIGLGTITKWEWMKIREALTGEKEKKE